MNKTLFDDLDISYWQEIYKELYYSSGYYEWRNVGVCNDCLTGKMITNGEVLEFVPGKISKC